MDAASNETELRTWEAVERVAGVLLANLDQDDILSRLCGHALVELGCDASHVFVWQEEHQAFAARAQAGEAAAVWGHLQLLSTPVEALGRLPELLRNEGATRVVFAETAVHPGLEGLAPTSPEELGLSPRVSSLAHLGGWRHCLFTPILEGDRLTAFQTWCWHDAGVGLTGAQVQLARRLACLAAFAVHHTSLARDLRRATRLQAEFVANMSHELRTPLNVIIGYNALLLEGEYGPLDELQHDILGRIAVRARELFEMIRSTLDVGRLESGEMPFEARDIDVRKLMAEVEHDTLHLQTRPEVRFAWHHEEPLPILHSDPSKLRVVLANLLSNAAKFTQRGEVNVLARASENAVQFVVSDTGVGIEPERLATVFEPFRRGEQEGAPRVPGVGLGLYIVRRLTERLGGEVLVESQPGKGSRFVAQLPLRPVMRDR